MRIYVPVVYKLAFSLTIALLWLTFSLWMARPWIDDLGDILTPIGAWVCIIGVALLPGLASAFVVASLLFDRRPEYPMDGPLPPVTILIAAFNEQEAIVDTLASILAQDYPGEVETVLIDDGSTDETVSRAQHFISQHKHLNNYDFRVLKSESNAGKASALNTGLSQASHELIITVDADTYLYRNSLRNIVCNMVYGPAGTGAVAGTVLVRNSRNNFLSRLQEWDYFLGIAVVKRTQSLYQGTLVAQGAFSIYRRDVLLSLGGWPDTVGEDIVLTWGISQAGWRVSYAENAFVFTNVPETVFAYFRQRRRWARGLIEAFKQYPQVMYKPRMNTPFIYFNMLFPYIDFSFLFIMVPGVIAALFFGWYELVGVMTLLLLPLAALCNLIMYYRQRSIFRQHGLKVRRNVGGLVVYALCYQLILAPASLTGYMAEFLRTEKKW